MSLKYTKEELLEEFREIQSRYPNEPLPRKIYYQESKLVANREFTAYFRDYRNFRNIANGKKEKQYNDDFFALHREYMEGKSLNDLFKKYKMSIGYIEENFKRLGLFIKPKEQIYKERMEKVKKTCFTKYGVSCGAKIKEVRERAKEKAATTDWTERDAKAKKTKLRNNLVRYTKRLEKDGYELISPYAGIFLSTKSNSF